MSLPELKYYSLTKAAKCLKCETDDILYYASVGLLDVGVRLDFSEFIKKNKLAISAKTIKDKGRVTPHESCDLKRKRLKYKTNHAQILEDALYYERDGKIIIQDRKVITAKGIFSINKRWFFESTSDIRKGRKVKIEGFLISRLPEFLIEELEVYTPYAVNIIDDFVELSLDDLIITSEEIELIKNGGITTNFRLNKGHFKGLTEEMIKRITGKDKKVNERISSNMVSVLGLLFYCHPDLGPELAKTPYKAVNVLNAMAKSSGKNITINAETLKNWLIRSGLLEP